MARIDPSLRMSESDIDALMSTETRCRIGTLGPGSDIHITPMTFGWAGGKVFTFGRGQKVANLRRTPTATVLVDTGDAWRELRGVMLRGSARILEDAEAEAAEADLEAAGWNLGQKHNLHKDGSPIPYRASASGRSRRWIVFEPRSVVSWDNSNL